ncbi:SDR family oxidoreductase [Lysobacter sp. CA196]|uniref:SDR family oxidoreductase n=1 Tax=Lysobacter sp. CA196 TaxID=3455606 RepID=UPI003F8D22A0
MRKHILITGASSGLGRGMAREFARAGSDLALCARRLDRLEALKAELEAAHPGIRVAVRSLDVTDHEQVFTVFRSLRAELGAIDRIIVNAGIGQGAPVGKGQFALNRSIVETNFIAALAQCEAAMEIFREAGLGHLVLISSMSAMRGMRGGLTAYAASKAGVASLAEGIRTDMLHKPSIKVSTIFPGYIRTEMNDQAPARQTPYIIDEATGCRLLVRAIDRESAKAYVPWWPWALLGWLMKRLPLSWVAKLN